MLKLPKEKYEPNDCKALDNYARGWNSIIDAMDLCETFGDERTKEKILKSKEFALKSAKEPFFKGKYDCIVEIKKLNEKTESEHRLDNLFKDSLETLDKLNIRGE